MVLNRFFNAANPGPADQRSVRVTVGAAGALAFAAGLAVIVPGIKELAISAGARLTGTPIHEPSSAEGWVLIAIGIALLIAADLGLANITALIGNVMQGQRPGSFIALKHQSFAPAPKDLTRDDLLQGDRRAKFVRVEVDQHEFVAQDDIAGAVGSQRDLVNRLRESEPDRDDRAIIGYHGIVHAPFQVWAGHQLSTWRQVRRFELDRDTGDWRPLQPGAGPDLRTTTRTSRREGRRRDAVIAVSVSYRISQEEIDDCFPDWGRLSRISAAAPALDLVTHDGQVNAIGREFRKVLDEMAEDRRQFERVILLCAAPVSVGFELGRRLSQTLHPPLEAYAYAVSRKPAYVWGLRISGGGAEPILNNSNGGDHVLA